MMTLGLSSRHHCSQAFCTEVPLSTWYGRRRKLLMCGRSRQVGPPRVKECAVQMECKLKHVYNLHDR